MDEASELCDHVAFLHDGKVAGIGTPSDLCEALKPDATLDDVFIALTRAHPSSAVGDYVSQTLAIAEAEVRKLRHDPIDLFTRIVQPALWLLIFGQVFARLRDVPTGGVSYRDFLAPGILAQSVLFIAIFYGISTIWERDLGIFAMYLVSPAPRSALVLGKSLAAPFAPRAGDDGLRAGTAARVLIPAFLRSGVRRPAPLRWSCSRRRSSRPSR